MLAAVVIILIATLTGGPKAVIGNSSTNPWVAPYSDPAVTSALAKVPAADFAKAGTFAALGKITAAPSSNGLVKLTGPKLTGTGGKPKVIFLGSEYCPYCAATRWPFIIALSRFGSFSGLQVTASSPLDIFRNTPTLTFAKATYTSPYFQLVTTEELTNHCPDSDVITNTDYSQIPASDYASKYACKTNYFPLQTPPKQTSQLAAAIDTDATFGSGNGNGIPFIDFGGIAAEDGALYNPGILHGATPAQVVAALSVPNQNIGQAILSVANRYTAILCTMTGGTPGSVCNTPIIKKTITANGL